MNPSARRDAFVAAALLAAAHLLLALWLLPDFGLTWDGVIGEHPAGEKLLAYLGSGCSNDAWLDVAAAEPRPAVRAPHPAFPVGGFALHQVSTLNSVLSALTCRVFWTELGWLPAIEAHHLATVLLTTLFVFLLTFFVSRRAGWRAGICASGALLTMPRFFTHSFNNPKDLPVALLYGVAAAAGWAAMRSAATGGRRNARWLAAGAVTGAALASKANALFVPVQLALLWAAAHLLRRRGGGSKLTVRPIEVLLAGLTFAFAWFALSPDLWHGPIDAARARFEAIAAAGSDDSGHISPHGLVHALWTTPPVLLAGACAGLLRPGLALDVRLFLGLGLLVPIGRTLLPGMANFDGVRHFLEFAPFLACSAGLGFDWLAGLVAHRLAESRTRAAVAAALLALFAPAIYATATTHPFGTSYYNAFVGGLPGAQARGIPDATDYWAHSYRRGLAWLGENAPNAARLVVPVGGHVVTAMAPTTLRADLEPLPDDVDAALDRCTFVMAVTRPERTPFLRAVEAEIAPCHTITVQGAPILEIWRLEPGDAAAERVWSTRRRGFELDVQSALQTLATWLTAHPEHFWTVTLYSQGLRSDKADETEALLRALLPTAPFTPATVDALVWHWRNG